MKNPVKKPRAPTVKNLLARLIGKGLTTEKIISLFRKDHHEAIAKENEDLIDIALTKLVSQVGALQSGPATDLQIELFHEYSLQKKLNVIVDTPEGPEKVWKESVEVSVAEAQRYVAEHQRQPMRKLSGHASELERLLSECNASSAPPNSNLMELWTAARSAKKKEQ